MLVSAAAADLFPEQSHEPFTRIGTQGAFYSKQYDTVLGAPLLFCLLLHVHNNLTIRIPGVWGQSSRLVFLSKAKRLKEPLASPHRKLASRSARLTCAKRASSSRPGLNYALHADGLDMAMSVQRLAALPDMTRAARIEEIESSRLSTESFRRGVSPGDWGGVLVFLAVGHTGLAPARVCQKRTEAIMMTRISDVDRTFAAMDELRRKMERAFDDYEGRPNHGFARAFFEPFEFGQSRPVATWPRLSVYDTGSALVLYAEVPGLKDSDIKIEIAQDVLSLSGERKADAPEGYAVHRRERAPVKFARSLTLPCKVDVEKATATVTDGVLTLTLPKSAEAQPRKIAVKAIA